MRIHAKLHCQNMQKNTTLQENDLKIPAKFGMRIEAGGGQTVQADWAQNDSTAADYVKNRPGGYYGELVTVDEEIYSGEIEQALADMLVDWLLVAGQTYKVIIGEVTKTYTAFADSFSGFSGVTIGDGTIEDAAKSGEMFALFSAENKGDKEALLVCTEADVGKTIRVTQFGTAREVHKIPTELLDLGGVDESINQTNAALDALRDQHVSDIFSINKMLTEGPITFKRGNKTLELGKYDANNGLILRWDNVNGGYTMLSQSGLVAKYSDVEFLMTVFNVSLIEKTHDSGIHFKLEKSDINGGTRFILDNVAGDKTTFYASGKIINSNKLLQLSANDTITEDNATTLRGVKTPEQKYDAANKKYVDQRLPSPATAQVGQIVKVKAVDAYGKITETEAVNMPSGGGVGGHWETVLDTVWEQDVINPTAFNSETGIFTCAEGELNNLELNKKYVFYQQCTKEGAAYNTILNNEVLEVTKLSDTTFSINVTPPSTFVPTNVKFSKGAGLAVTDIDAKKIRLTLDGQFHPTATLYDKPFYGTTIPYFGHNTGYVQIRNAYQAYQQVTAEVESPFRIVGEILCGFNAPSNNGNFHFKNNSFCCPLIPYDVPAGYERTYLLTSDGTKIAKLYFNSGPWMGINSDFSIGNDFLKIISGTKVKLERWVE